MTLFGVPLFTEKPIQPSTASLGNPSSTIVGTSFRAATCFGPVMANARNLPELMRSTTGDVVMNMYWLVPLSRSAIAWVYCW